MLVNTGKCRYCGQIRMFDTQIEEEDAEREATLDCTCTGAKTFKQNEARREKAKDNIELAIYKIDQEVCEYTKQCVELVDRGRIAKITVDLGAGIKKAVLKTNKGTIKVTKKISKDVIYDE